MANSFPWSEEKIRRFCGLFSFEKGEVYFQQKRVTFLEFNEKSAVYEAEVQGKRSYFVSVHPQRNGELYAECSCPAYEQYEDPCKHIAAVLLEIRERELEQEDWNTTHADASADAFSEKVVSDDPLRQNAPANHGGLSYKERQMASSVLGLFADKPARPTGNRSVYDTRTVLETEIILQTVPYGVQKHMLGIALKLGPKRLYIVQNVKEFLERMDRKEPQVFSKQFTYDPQLHSFDAKTDAVLQLLIHIQRNEALYKETANASYMLGSFSRSSANSRTLLVPPIFWERLLPLLLEAPSVTLEQHGHSYHGLQLSEEAVPLQFTVDEAPGGSYRLEVDGLENITILELYGVVLHEGKVLRLGDEHCRRLGEIQRLLHSSRSRHLLIPPEQIEPYVEKVVPGLMQLGAVQIAGTISERITQLQLQAKLYLDRVKDRLLAGLEFHYGSIVINPLEEAAGISGRTASDRILIRDGEREARILQLMAGSGFIQNEAGYTLVSEEEEFEFLSYVVPELEKLLDIHATSAVKARLFSGPVSPVVKVDVDERTDWLEFRFEMEGISEKDIRQVLKALEEKRKYYRLPSGALMPLEREELQEMIRFLNEVGVRSADLKGTGLRLPLARGVHGIEADRHGRSVKLGRSLRQLLEHMRNPDHLNFPVPESLAPVLRDYQAYGYQWMKTLAHYRFGGILADDMGLGKTLQSIAFLVSVLEDIRSLGQPALIVSPASLIYNWRNELAKFAPEVRAVIIDGSKAERMRMMSRSTADAGTGDAAGADVWITSYPLLRKDMELYAKHEFHTLFLDEAQAFKNYTTQTAQAVKTIAARYRFALTGTPLENSLEELWSIYDAVFPELFPSRRAYQEMSRETIARRVRPFLLRRVKSDVLQELPEKIETLQSSELLPEQKKLYAAYLVKLQQETLKHIEDKGFEKNRIRILAGLTRLRQICCHPALFVEGYRGSSGKFQQLLELIDDCRSAGKRMLVFSQFTEMLGLIGRELGSQGIPFFYLDGSTPAAERVELCAKFNEGQRDLFLISLKAGGTGLNLTGADTVILYDLWWNPAVEQQAADRAHRMGQKKVVHVIRLVAEGTVEDKMYALQQRKKHLIEEVIQPGQETLSSLSEQEVRELLMLG
ncbi:DEAD/DEAH box helicase [Paenibacillus turpanensis]|uniref:DEAD/DEAH box helicase n=1 Tax=Paenibacillus turpanensis TaxID=2689078 RepID=UPI00140E5E5F|nr:DEAD/DEAH box helicase [Paenibacillus turpanensis]